MSGRRSGRARLLVVMASAASIVSAGCGGEPGATEAPAELSRPQPRGALVVAVASAPGPVDPLLADDRVSRLLTAQIHEPLVDRLTAPFGDPRRRTGIARRWRPSRDGLRWSFILRRNVRFQDGTALNARAVVANADRWVQSAAALELLPGLVAADAPRPDKARLIFASPLRDLPQRLPDPSLGIVSPAALEPGRGGRIRIAAGADTGTGPFELRQRSPRSLVLARNTDWWASPFGFGPGLDQIELRVVKGAARRAQLLRTGAVWVADRLGDEAAEALATDPLNAVVHGPTGTAMGISRAVRGIDSTRAGQSLADVWLTTLLEQ